MEGTQKMTQREEILEHIREHGYITRLDAACELHIFELASRIGELKKMGYNITSERINARNKNGRRTHYNIYKLEA